MIPPGPAGMPKCLPLGVHKALRGVPLAGEGVCATLIMNGCARGLLAADTHELGWATLLAPRKSESAQPGVQFQGFNFSRFSRWAVEEY